jgi:long-chain acyl-CoA synthetase
VPPIEIHTPGLLLGESFLSRDALLADASRAASGLAALGVGEGDSVALLLRNDLPFFVASYGAARLGAYAVPINFHARAHEVDYLLRDCGAKILVGHSDLLRAVASAIPSGLPVIAVEPGAALRSTFRLAAESCPVPAGMTEWTGWLARQTPLDQWPPRAVQSMIYTSGTTGRPKGVRREPATDEQEAKIAAMRRRVYGIEAGIRALLPGPLYHSAPNAFGLRAARLAERLVIMPRFDPQELLRLIERHRITTIFMVPTMFVRLLKLPESVRRRYDLSSLRFVIHAAAPCPVEVKRAMIDWWGPVLNEFYGATETGALTLCTSAEFLARPGTVGRPVDEAIIRILDDSGRALPAGVPGEIFMRLPYYPDFTYHGQDDKRREIERDGLLTCGDVGYFDEDGYLYLCDRKRDMVIIGGANIYPAEIEAVLIGLPGVKDCAIIGIPDPEYGEALLALVEPQDGAALDPADLLRLLATSFAGFKLPRRIELRATLPREDSGKIFKRLLREPYWQGAGRSI